MKELVLEYKETENSFSKFEDYVSEYQHEKHSLPIRFKKVHQRFKKKLGPRYNDFIFACKKSYFLFLAVVAICVMLTVYGIFTVLTYFNVDTLWYYILVWFIWCISIIYAFMLQRIWDPVNYNVFGRKYKKVRLKKI